MSIKEKQNSQTFQDFDSLSNFKPKSENEILDFIDFCNKKNIPIEIKGHGTKSNIGRNFQSEKTLDLSNYSGIIKYEPEELYIKVKSGTPLDIIEKELEKNNQHFAFEPINFGYLFDGESKGGTIGGTMACNFSGSRRFKSGSVRDHILGVKIVNGRGEAIKSGGTVVKNVTGYDLSKIVTGSFGTLAVISEIAIKVLPLPPAVKTLMIHNAQLKKALEYINISLSSSSDVSGAVFYPEYFKRNFIFNDLVQKGPITAIRVEGVKSSIDSRIRNLIGELSLLNEEVNLLDDEQSKIFWKFTQNLRVFEKTNKNLIKVVVPPSETLTIINTLKKFLSRYFIDWGGNLIWMEIEKINSSILSEIGEAVNKARGYLTMVKLDDSLKAGLDVFQIDPVKYEISEKIKKSFDPKRILNPGKMYSGI